MKSFSVSRLIAAPPERVWAILTDAPRLVSAAIGITRIDGRIGAGERLKLWTDATGSRAFALRVAEFHPAQRMVWVGGMPLGLFTGTRRYRLTPEPGGTRFDMSEAFTGLMAPLIAKSIPDLTPSFERFADGLKKLAEEQTR